MVSIEHKPALMEAFVSLVSVMGIPILVTRLLEYAM